MKIISLVFVLNALVHLNTYASNNFDIATEFEFESKILGEKRLILVSVPEGYQSSKATYPVIFLLDGLQNLRHVVGTTEVLTRTGSMPATIIIAIKSENRMKDFTPSFVADMRMSGGGKKFLEFLENELIPFIDSEYRTNDYRILEGHSLAGLFTAYTFMQAPDLFSAYAVMSPAFWWNKEELTAKLKLFLASNSDLDKTLFFGIGADDGYGMKQELKRFVIEIENSACNKIRWAHREFEGEGHMSAPLLINYYALKFIFNDIQLPKDILEKFNDSNFISHETGIVEKYGESARQTQEVYVKLGMNLMKQKNYKGAITVFQRNAQAYGANNYPQNYAWLAEAYEKNNDENNALRNYIKAYELSRNSGYGEGEKYRSKVEELKAYLGLSDEINK